MVGGHRVFRVRASSQTAPKYFVYLFLVLKSSYVDGQKRANGSGSCEEAEGMTQLDRTRLCGWSSKHPGGCRHLLVSKFYKYSFQISDHLIAPRIS